MTLLSGSREQNTGAEKKDFSFLFGGGGRGMRWRTQPMDGAAHSWDGASHLSELNLEISSQTCLEVCLLRSS